VQNIKAYEMPIPVAARSKTWVCGRWVVGIAGWVLPTTWMSVCCVVCCCQVEVSATSWSLFQRSPTECDREASTMRWSWPTRGSCVMEEERYETYKKYCNGEV